MKLKTVRIIGVPLDYGADRRGVDMGPSAIRYAGLHEKLRQVGHKVIDIGNLPVPVPESRTKNETHLKYADEIVKVSRVLARAVEKSLDEDNYPLILGVTIVLPLVRLPDYYANFPVWACYGLMHTGTTIPIKLLRPVMSMGCPWRRP